MSSTLSHKSRSSSSSSTTRASTVSVSRFIFRSSRFSELNRESPRCCRRVSGIGADSRAVISVVVSRRRHRLAPSECARPCFRLASWNSFRLYRSGESLRNSDQRSTRSVGAMCMITWIVVPGTRLRNSPCKTPAICDTAASAIAPTLRGSTFHTHPRPASLGFFGS